MKLLKANIFGSLAILSFLLLMQFACSSKQASENSSIEQKSLLVFLVRHAEKIDHSKDPELSRSGKERALELVNALSNSNVQYIHSSDFIRTRDTAAPMAKELGLKTKIYDHKNLEALAQKIKAKGGNHLVVGHSGSTPSMVSLLGGDPGPAINDAAEYDRLYIVKISESGDVNSKLMRYGTPYVEIKNKK